MATKLTDSQLAAARAALAESEAADAKALTDQILFEAKRDEVAYGLIQAARAETPRRNLSLADAQAEATKILQAEPPAPAADAAAEPARRKKSATTED